MNASLALDHAELDKLRACLLASLDAGDIARSHAKLDLFWARLAMHIRAEHLHLFPAILGAAGAERESVKGAPSLALAKDVIERLRCDHDLFMRELAGAMRLMRELLAKGGESATSELQKVRARVETVSRRLSAHNELEEELVYRWTDALLNKAEQRDLDARVLRELEKMPPRFNDDHVSYSRASGETT